MGNVIYLLGGSGQGIEYYTYDAFGQPAIHDWNGQGRTESAYGNRFMFQGREWIKELGIYDYRNRMYHPGLGRFLQPDPIGFAAGDANLFRYCGDDPINQVDPFGLAAEQQPGGRPPPPKRKDGNDIGNSNNPNAPISTQGWWTNPDGTPTNSTGGSGPDTGNQGGGRSGDTGGYYSYMQGNRVVVVRWGNGPAPAFPGNDLGFRPGMISMGPRVEIRPPDDKWGQFYNWLKYRPVSAEKAAWTDKGRVPTLIAAGVLAAPFIAPQTGLYAATAAGGYAVAAWTGAVNAVETFAVTAIYAGYVGYQGLMANPQYIVRAQQFVRGFTPGMGGATSSYYGAAGWGTRAIINEYDEHH